MADDNNQTPDKPQAHPPVSKEPPRPAPSDTAQLQEVEPTMRWLTPKMVFDGMPKSIKRKDDGAKKK